VTELEAASGYLLDTTPHRIEVKDGQTATLEITNRKACSILIHKIDANTGDGIYGVTFVIYDSGRNPIMEVTTDQDGYAYIDKELAAGKYYIRELEAADGYILDKQYKTVYVEAGKTSTIEWENTAVTGQIQITKYAAESNAITGQAGGVIDTDGLPTWIPQDYSISGVTAKITDGVTRCVAVFESERGELTMRVTAYSMENTAATEERDETSVCHSRGGVDYYIISNYDQSKVGWQLGLNTYVIGGQISENEVKEIIDSIT